MATDTFHQPKEESSPRSRKKRKRRVGPGSRDRGKFEKQKKERNPRHIWIKKEGKKKEGVQAANSPTGRKKKEKGGDHLYIFITDWDSNGKREKIRVTLLAKGERGEKSVISSIDFEY